MLKDTIYIFQFQDPVEKEPSDFDWSLDMKEVEFNHKLIGYPDESQLKEQQLFMDILNQERNEISEDRNKSIRTKRKPSSGSMAENNPCSKHATG